MTACQDHEAQANPAVVRVREIETGILGRTDRKTNGNQMVKNIKEVAPDPGPDHSQEKDQKTNENSGDPYHQVIKEEAG